MTEGLYIDPASMKALGLNFKRFRKEVLASAHEGLVQFAMRIVAQAKEFILHNGQLASGALRDSGTWFEQPDGTVDAGFYVNYAEYVEYGRKAGGMPPVDDIEQWILRKGRRREDEGKSALYSASVFTGKSVQELAHNAAWAIAKSIAENGTDPHPFLKPAYEMYRNKIDEFMRAQINETIKKFKEKE